MIRPLSLAIGLRYTRARRRNHFVSFISVMSTLGIMLGVMALITVLSVMNGFGKELRERVLGAVSHLTIERAHGPLHDGQALMSTVRAEPGVVGVAPYVEGQGMLSAPAGAIAVNVRGIDPVQEMAVSSLHLDMRTGRLEDLVDGAYGIIIGRSLAWRLRLSPGDKVQLLSSRLQVTPVGMIPRSRQFTVVGIHETGMGDFDDHLVLMHIRDGARLYMTGNGMTGIRAQTDDLFAAPAIAARLNQKLGETYRARDWSVHQSSLFRALKIEKIVMFVILMLMVAIAAFNIVSMLVMQVTDKRADIAILRTLGMGSREIMAIFMINGAMLGVVGTLVGSIGGILLAHNIQTVVQFFERLMGGSLFTEEIYYYTGLVADLYWQDVLLIVIASIAVAIASTIYPARRAAALNPAEALRYD